ncbi:hypothetical protein SLS64_009059 [Diaporthe eres]
MMSNAAPRSFQDWSFDVSSLMILLGEPEEKRYRLAGRSLAEALVAAPAAGIQCYLKSYDIHQELSDLSYLSPYGCKIAPLRNLRLDNVIRQQCLLKDGRYTTYRVQSRRKSTLPWLIAMWTAITWLVFLTILIAFTFWAGVTWIGLSTCIVFTAWSILIRLIEYHMASPPPIGTVPVNRPSGPDAAVFLGRANSAVVLEGSREEIKHWTSCGIVYKDSALGIPASFWQYATRLGTLLTLVFIFIAIPNGSPADQLMFIVLNILGQANVLLGYYFTAQSCLECLELVEDQSSAVATRTHVYAQVLRQFRDMKNSSWVEKLGFLPETPVWREWKDRIVAGPGLLCDPKELYDLIVDGQDQITSSVIRKGCEKPGKV